MVESIEDVQAWLNEVGFSDYRKAFEEGEIDGEALLCLTERALEQLIPRMGPRMKFLKLLEKLKQPKVPKPLTDIAQVIEVGNIEVGDIEVGDIVIEVGDCPDLAATCSGIHKEEKSPVADRSSDIAVVMSPSGSKPVFNAKKLWPATVTLPKNLRPELTRVLNSGNEREMTGKLRKAFILRLFEHFSTFTLYPTRDQLTHVCQRIVKDYPFLKDKSSIGSGYDSWFLQLYEKFRNERKTMKDPEVLLHKKRKAVDGKEKVTKSLRRGGINWEPAFPEGEDEMSMKCHRNALKAEWKKRTPDMDKIKIRMDITFADRRGMINEKKPLAEMQEEYPALFSYSEMIAEFERILCLTSSVVDMFKLNFGQMVQGVIEVSRRKSNKCQNAEELKAYLSLLDATDADQMEIESSNELADVAMAILPFLLQHKSGKSVQEHFVQFLSEEESFEEIVSNRTEMAPKILIQGQLDTSPEAVVIAEKLIICKVNGSLVEATIALMATMYVFMLEYPPRLKHFCMFLQKCVLQIEDGKKLPSSVISLMNELNSK